MSGFSKDWLALREPADRQARNLDLVAALIAWHGDNRELHAVDLAAGTGATLRYLAPRLGGVQTWRLLDHDSELLELVAPLTRAWAEEHGWRFEGTLAGYRVTGPGLEVSIRLQSTDLSGDPGTLDLPAKGLVTASALLDLVSGTWLEAISNRCHSLEAAVYASLNYDGRVTQSPALLDDRLIWDLVNRHQSGDKGFGAALGPGCTEDAVRSFEDLGYRVLTGQSDWCLGKHDRDLLGQLFRGWAMASAELRPDLASRIDSWLSQRLEILGTAQVRTTVGHQDVLALPS